MDLETQVQTHQPEAIKTVQILKHDIQQHCQLLQLYSTGDERMSTVHWWNDTDGETEALKETTWRSASLFTIYPTCTTPGMNLGRHGGKPEPTT